MFVIVCIHSTYMKRSGPVKFSTFCYVLYSSFISHQSTQNTENGVFYKCIKNKILNYPIYTKVLALVLA